MCIKLIEKEYITIQDFANKCDLKENTIIKNIRKIPGAEPIVDGYRFLSGTRYPYNMRSTKLTDSSKRRYILLKAISESRYIDHSMLKMEEHDFIQLLQQLITAGWIEENNGCNCFGANKYNATLLGEEMLLKHKREKSLHAAEMLGAGVGAFYGVVHSITSNNPG